jgi:hypothetical protein
LGFSRNLGFDSLVPLEVSVVRAPSRTSISSSAALAAFCRLGAKAGLDGGAGFAFAGLAALGFVAADFVGPGFVAADFAGGAAIVKYVKIEIR